MNAKNLFKKSSEADAFAAMYFFYNMCLCALQFSGATTFAS